MPYLLDTDVCSLTVVTHNGRHYEPIAELVTFPIEDWAAEGGA